MSLAIAALAAVLILLPPPGTARALPISRFHRLPGRHAWRFIFAANALAGDQERTSRESNSVTSPFFAFFSGAPLIWLLALSSIAHAAEPLSFKGLMLGASKEDVLRRFPSAVCPANRSGCLLTAKYPPSGGAKMEAERESMTIATVPFDSAVFMFHSGRLDAILISAKPDGYNRIALAMADRYGRPMPSSASQDIAVWELPEGTIELHRSPSESSIVYSSKRRNTSTPTPADQRKKAASDL